MTVIINPIVQQQTIAINSFGVGLNGLPNGATDSLMELKYLFEGFHKTQGAQEHQIILYQFFSQNL